MVSLVSGLSSQVASVAELIIFIIIVEEWWWGMNREILIAYLAGESEPISTCTEPSILRGDMVSGCRETLFR